MCHGNNKVYWYDAQSTVIDHSGIRDQKQGYVIKFKPRSWPSPSNRCLSVGERNIGQFEFIFHGNEGVVLKIKRGWVRHGHLYRYHTAGKAVKLFQAIQKSLHALGYTTLDVT